MTRRLLATAMLVVTVGGPIFAAVPADAGLIGGGGNPSILCVGGDTSHRGERGMCVPDPTHG